MREMDEDGDDQIDFEEFFAWCANNRGLAEALEKSVLGADAEAAQGASLRNAPKGGLGRAYQVTPTPFCPFLFGF